MPTIYSRNKETGGFEKVGIGNIAIPKKTSDLINDSGFIDEAAVDLKISEIPIPDVSAQIEAHNTSDAAHGNIRSRMSQVEDRLDKITDNKVTNTLNVSEKAYITGTTSSSTNTGTQVFDTGVYLSDTPGELVATTFVGTLDGNAKSATSATNDASGNVITTTYETKSDASQKLLDAKNYTDDKIANLLDNSTEAVDSIFELKEAMEDNAEAIDALTQIAGTKASQSDFKGHVDDTTIHTNESEKANWNAAYDHTGNKSNPHVVTLTQLGVTATAAELNTLDGITATVTELNYVDGVTSNIQEQLNGKQATITGAATTIASSNLTASRALVTNSSGKVAVLSSVTSAEIGYLDGVTSKIQTQLDNKIDKTNPTGTGSFSLNRNANSEIGDYSFAEGYNTIASGKCSHAEGQSAIAFSDYSHAEGRGNATSVTITGDANTNTYTLASADSSLLVGQVIFYQNKYAIITAYDSSVPSITVNTTLSDKALNSVSATLYKLAASGSTSHAEGWNTVASGNSSHAEGNGTAASGNSSHAECYHTTASGQFSHAEGCYTTASGDSSHAEGNHTTASGKFSHAGGYYTIAAGENQTVIGKHNISDTTSSFIIGNGTANSETKRSNAHTIDGSGNAWFAGDVYVGSTSGKNKDNGSRKLASITETWTFTLEDGSTVTKAVYVG